MAKFYFPANIPNISFHHWAAGVALATPIAHKGVLAGARVLANCTHFAMTKLIVPGLIRGRDPKLTPRERECLTWGARGKTAYEIGMILHIAETTAVFHLNNVVRKFNVANRTQAIAVGVAMGLVY